MPSGVCIILITFILWKTTLCWERYSGGSAWLQGKIKDGAPMPKPLAAKAGGRTCSAAYALLPTQEPLPPYELDPMFNDPAVRKRIGEVIAKAMEHRFSKR
jgi:hypothetical protein